MLPTGLSQTLCNQLSAKRQLPKEIHRINASAARTNPTCFWGRAGPSEPKHVLHTVHGLKRNAWHMVEVRPFFRLEGLKSGVGAVLTSNWITVP